MKLMPVTHDTTKCRMRQVGWKIVPRVMPCDFCRMKSDGVGWSWMESVQGPVAQRADSLSSK